MVSHWGETHWCLKHGALRLRPASHARVLTCVLAIVLESMAMVHFEPIESFAEKFLTLKTAFLLAITSLKRVGDLQALSVSPLCLEFAPGMMKAFLHPRPGYVLKVPTNVARPIILQDFCPPPFQTVDQEKLNLLCPVRALNAYVHRPCLCDKICSVWGTFRTGLGTSGVGDISVPIAPRSDAA